MTAHQKQGLSWLEWRSQQTGKSIEELRAEMSNIAKQRRTIGGFKGNPDLARQAQKLSTEAKRKKKDAQA